MMLNPKADVPNPRELVRKLLKILGLDPKHSYMSISFEVAYDEVATVTVTRLATQEEALAMAKELKGIQPDVLIEYR